MAVEIVTRGSLRTRSEPASSKKRQNPVLQDGNWDSEKKAGDFVGVGGRGGADGGGGGGGLCIVD
eukprot:scaffold1748_cov261-Chaetoceros_neogracile.AAC.3